MCDVRVARTGGFGYDRFMIADVQLLPLPSSESTAPWPTAEWPRALPPVPIPDELLDPDARTHGETQALVVVYRGALVLERYPTGGSPSQSHASWSVAKSISHAVVGLAVADGLLALDRPPPVASWTQSGDDRGQITLEQLLHMTDGLDFVENDLIAGRSDAWEMVHRSGRDDVAAYAEARPLLHPPGCHWSYSSGATNIVMRALGNLLGGRDAMARYLDARLFARIGMRSAQPQFDSVGTFIGGSCVTASALDYARFGLLYLRDGIWEGERLLPEGWVDHARTPTAASKGVYGAHWWLDLGPKGCFAAKGHLGQCILVDPMRDLVIVRLGDSRLTQRPEVDASLDALCKRFPTIEGS